MPNLRIGEERTEYIEVVKGAVPYPHSRSGSSRYEAEKGEYIVCRHPIQHTSHGCSGWQITDMGADTDFISEQGINDSFNALTDYSRSRGVEDRYRDALERIRRYFLETYNRVRSSYSRIDVDWHIEQDGVDPDRRGGGLHLGLRTTRIRFFGPGELEEVKAHLQSLIKQQSDLPTWGGILQGGHVVARSDRAGEWETLRLVQVDPRRIAIGTHVGFFSAIAGGGGRVVANRPWTRDWELWTMERNYNGTVSFRSFRGFYLCAEAGGGCELVANRRKKAAWEMFTLEYVPGGVALKARKGQYVSVEP